MTDKSPIMHRRKFLQTCLAAVSAAIFLPPYIPGLSISEWFSETFPVSLVRVDLPAMAALPDRLLARIIDTAHPISQEEIDAQITPRLVKIPLTRDGIRAANENIQVHSLLLADLQLLFDQANLDRTGLFLHSGFRSFEQQAIAYSQANNKSVVMLPGTSQHHSGLALDFTSADIGKLIDIGLHFETTKAGKWLDQNAWTFGFLRSYTGSHDGIRDEPWHYLYVGRELAEAFKRLKAGEWYGDVFLLQRAINLGMRQIVLGG